MFGRTLHPLDAERVPGGSSGGSAAAVAANLVDCYRVLSSVEAVTNLARFDGVRFGLRVAAGDFAAMRTATRARLIDEVRSAFASADLVITPATPFPAFLAADADVAANHDSDAFLLAANLAGVPAMSVPFGRSDGLPLGIQLIAPWWREHVMIAAGGVLESASS